MSNSNSSNQTVDTETLLLDTLRSKGPSGIGLLCAYCPKLSSSECTKLINKLIKSKDVVKMPGYPERYKVAGSSGSSTKNYNETKKTESDLIDFEKRI